MGLILICWNKAIFPLMKSQFILFKNVWKITISKYVYKAKTDIPRLYNKLKKTAFKTKFQIEEITWH